MGLGGGRCWWTEEEMEMQELPWKRVSEGFHGLWSAAEPEPEPGAGVAE